MALIYDKSIDFNYQAEGHRYTIRKAVGDKWTEAEPVTGVTTIISIIAKDFLAPWAAKLAAEYMRDEIKAAKKAGARIQSYDALALEAKNQYVKAGDKGKKSGKVGHALVEALQKGQKVIMPSDPELAEQAASIQKAYEAYIKDFKPIVRGAELSVYSRAHHFAGTYDQLCEIGGKLTLLDYKTTNTSRYNPDGIYAEYFAQLGAYSLAYEEMTGEKIEQLMVVNLPKDGSEYKIKTLDDLKLSKNDAQMYFLACKQIYDINQLFNWRMK